MNINELEELHERELTEETIQLASKEEVDQWITDLREIPVSQSGHYDWNPDLPDLLCYQLKDSHLSPVPYCSEWWAADSLLQEMAEEIPVALVRVDNRWKLKERKWFFGIEVVGNTAPEAVAKAYLIAAKNGKLEIS